MTLPLRILSHGLLNFAYPSGSLSSLASGEARLAAFVSAHVVPLVILACMFVAAAIGFCCGFATRSCMLLARRSCNDCGGMSVKAADEDEEDEEDGDPDLDASYCR